MDLPQCRHRGQIHGQSVRCHSDKAARVGRGLALLSTCGTCLVADVPNTIYEIGVIDPAASTAPRVTECRHRSPLALKIEPCELCGARTDYAPIHRCEKHNCECTPNRFQQIKAGRVLTRDCLSCRLAREDG